jgi:hypothetical protein
MTSKTTLKKKTNNNIFLTSRLLVVVVGAVVACCSMFMTMPDTMCYWNKQKKQMKWRAALIFLSSMSPFCFHFSTVIEKKTSLSLVHRASSFSFFLYSHHILCRERLLLRSIHNSFETHKKNGMECARK